MAKRQQPLPLLPRCLRTEGVRTVPIFPDAEESRVSRKALRRELLQALQEFPEFLPGAEKLVLGSFGALGNPSSFHHPAVRRCRLLCMRPGLRLFRDFLATVPSKLGPRAPRRLELLWDRLCLRRPGDKMSGETAHRDLARFKLPEDEIFGGWLNLDSRSQFFHCVPGSHEDADQLPGQGFCREQTSRCMRGVEVPPGHLLVFYQNILHEVQKDSVAHTSLRLFVGWRLTRSTLSLQDLAARTQPGVLNTKALTTQQGLPLLPSGQKPPMYAKNHWCFWQKGLVAWSDGNLRECCKEQIQRKGTWLRLVRRTLPSLAELGLPMYAEYGEEELSIMKPNEEWTLFGRRYCLWPDFETVSLRPPTQASRKRPIEVRKRVVASFHCQIY